MKVGKRLVGLLAFFAPAAVLAADTVIDVAEGVVLTNTTALAAETEGVDRLVKKGKGTLYADCPVGRTSRFAELVVEEGTVNLHCGINTTGNCSVEKITVKSGATVLCTKKGSTGHALSQFSEVAPSLVTVEKDGLFDVAGCNVRADKCVLSFAGAGTIRNPTGTFLGPNFSGFAGTILIAYNGAPSLVFGDKTDAANDFPLAQIADIRVTNPYERKDSICNLYFQNLGATHVGRFPLTCAFAKANSAGKSVWTYLEFRTDLEIDDFTVANIQPKALATVTINGGDATMQKFGVDSSATVRLRRGSLSSVNRNYDRNRYYTSAVKSFPGSVNFDAAGRLIVEGGDVWPYQVHTKLVQLNGGRFWYDDCYMGSGTTVTNLWNGGKFYCWSGGSKAFTMGVYRSNRPITVAVGPNGGWFEAMGYNGSNMYFYMPICSGVASGEDGGLRVIGGRVSTMRFTQPFSFRGPCRILDSILYISNYATVTSSDHIFGYGDFELGNATLANDVYGLTLSFAKEPGKMLRAVGAAIIEIPLATKAATTFEVGAVGRAPGGALFLSQAGDGKNIDGSASRLVVTGGVATTAMGLPKAPVLQVNNTISTTSRYLELMSYDAAKGFVLWNAYTKTNEIGTSPTDVVKITDTKVTVSGTDAQAGVIRLTQQSTNQKTGSSCLDAVANLYLESGAKLTAGDGTDPALVVMNSRDDSYCAAIKGEGTLDFGAREGVFAVNGRRAIVGTTIAGAAVSFIGVGGAPAVQLARANTYAGPTYVNGLALVPETDGSLGTGDVWVGEGKCRGGRLYLQKEGLALANRLHLAGSGYGWGGANRGAVYATKSAKLTGDVELTGLAVAGVSGSTTELVFDGVISGDNGIRLYNPNSLDSVGTVVFAGANTYTGVTEVIRSTLVLRGPCSTGFDRVELDGGRIRFENARDVAYSNTVTGSGIIQLAGRGVVRFGQNLKGQENELFTLDVAARNVCVSTLNGIGQVTTSRTSPTYLSVLDDEPGSFTGSVPANVRLHYGTHLKPGLAVVVR